MLTEALVGAPARAPGGTCQTMGTCRRDCRAAGTLENAEVPPLSAWKPCPSVVPMPVTLQAHHGWFEGCGSSLTVSDSVAPPRLGQYAWAWFAPVSFGLELGWSCPHASPIRGFVPEGAAVVELMPSNR